MTRRTRKIGAPDHAGAERVSRREAAEHLTDLAYALTVGGPLKMKDGEVTGQVPDELLMKRESTADDDRVALRLVLSWSTDDRSGGRRPRRP